jgi:hypothetical protein
MEREGKKEAGKDERTRWAAERGAAAGRWPRGPARPGEPGLRSTRGR